ncbi:MAG: hypothetical protein JSU86_01285 [Phycisphaerales bacterium]|nr:MAG: hypothetical protein JSU86_01285 [Phycisphaerales bacterium]
MDSVLTSLLLLSAGFYSQTTVKSAEPTTARTGSLEILSALPEDVVFVAVVRDLAECDGKLTRLMERLGFPVSPYTLLKGALGIVTGLDDEGSAALALLAPGPAGVPSTRIALLMPTTDPTALLTFLNPQPVDEKYVKVTLRGRETYVGTKSRFSVFAPDIETVRHVVNAKTRLVDRFSARQLKRYGTNDVSFWVNVALMASGALGERPAWLKSTLGVESPEQYESFQWSSRIESEGLYFELSAARGEPSGTAKGRETTDSLLAGLPSERFVMALGLLDDDGGARLGSMVNLIISASTAFGVVEPSRSAALAQAYESVAGKITGGSASVSLLPEGPDGRLALTKVLHTRGDGRAVLDDVARILSVLKSGPFVDPRINRVAERIEYRRAAETSDTVIIDHMSVKLSEFEGIDHEALKKLLGPEGFLTRYAVVDGNTVVIALGGGLVRFNEVMALVRAKKAPLTEDSGIRQSAKKLSGERWLEAYLSSDRCLRLTKEVLAVTGVPGTFPDVSEPAVPAALTVHSVGPRETELRIFVPTELVVAVKDLMMARLAAQVGSGG